MRVSSIGLCGKGIVFSWCDENPKVQSWSSEETVVPYYYEIDKRYHKYYLDLKITFKEGKTILVEIKPEKETKPLQAIEELDDILAEATTYVRNMNKWEAADEYAKDNGYEFQVWTEKTLNSMGILPKSTKNL